MKSHQKYFTYNPHIDKKDFTIVDPISIVDTGNLDASFYAAWLTTSSFVQTEKRMDLIIYYRPLSKQILYQASRILFQFTISELKNWIQRKHWFTL